MKVIGDARPTERFTLEDQPKRPGYVLARFYCDPEPFEETIGGGTYSGWKYDEYHLELPKSDSLPEAIEADYDNYLKKAMEQEPTPEPEPEPEPASLEERVKALEADNVWDQMAEAYREGVNEA